MASRFRKMNDIVDRAKLAEMRHREISLRNTLTAGQDHSQPIWIEGQACCCSCEQPIPARRLRTVSTGYCIECKTRLEATGQA
jgi:RNA polymerase-binding transcription factor DksA